MDVAAQLFAPAVDGPRDDPANGLNPSQPRYLHSPPDSSNAVKSDASDSELSELDDEPPVDAAPPGLDASAEVPPAAEDDQDDIGDVVPDHWSGTVPVFKPTMEQFKDFKKFMKKVDSYGMTSGIIKIIPPQEWKDAQPKLDELIKQIRVREPIKQDIMGSNGTYRQVNILHGRSYNLPQWRQLCDQSEHQPPARRGERRANTDKPKPPRSKPAVPKQPDTSAPKKRGRGRPPKNKAKHDDAAVQRGDRPMTPVSPKSGSEEPKEEKPEVLKSVENDGPEPEPKQEPAPAPARMGGRMGGVKPAKEKTQSVSARRKNGRREGSVAIDEEAFKDFDYKMDISDYTAERCEELERAYWKTLTYAPPLYGADMMGTLFDDSMDTWNLNKLPNLLDVLGTKIPGVNTAYLYLGMWKATFAWHLEDVDLYSINYLHFGAPKQWYSISQADAPKFERAMKNIWPADAKSCSQFLRHKGYLISPQHLLSHYGIRVNKCLSYPGEFVVTYPYGYHSGYNLGYNCAEAVNFALDSWLPMGKIAKRCECSQAQDSVWIDVYEIERKLRGEPTPEYYEETEDEDEEDDEDMLGVLSPPPSALKSKHARKRKHIGERGSKKIKKLRLRLKPKADPPCCLCPNDFSGMEILPTNDGRKAHRMCALYIPETYIDTVEGQDVVCNLSNVHRDRLDLKCLFCRSKRGACFQCSQKKCARAYHATCAAAAGVFIEEQDIPVYGEDGVEYKEQAFEFSCRFHRTRRDKKLDGIALEADDRIHRAAKAVKSDEICQFQYAKGDIFAGLVIESRSDEETFLVSVVPTGERIDIEWKWLLIPDPSDYHLPKASPNALPLPASEKARKRINAKRQDDDKPRKGDEFAEGYTWSEFNLHDVAVNKDQVKVDFAKADQIWHYLGSTSTEAKAQYTEDPTKRRHNPKANFLDTIPKPPRPIAVPKVKQARQQGVPGGHLYHQQSYGRYIPPLAVGNTVMGRPYAHPQHAASPQAAGTHNVQIPYANMPAYSQRGQMVGNNVPQEVPRFTVHPSVYHTYQFFQIHFNREPSRYRTPYATCGGFINGYQNNCKAQLPINGSQAGSMRRVDNVPVPAGHFHGVPQPAAPNARPQPVAATAMKSDKAKATPPQKAVYKIPAKQSPVPLPPGFLAAMGASPPPAAAPGTEKQAATASPVAVTAPSQPRIAKPSEAAKISRTPVPLPSSALASRHHASIIKNTSTSQNNGNVDIASTEREPTPPQKYYQTPPEQQEFVDVPGRESMEFVDNMMRNLRRASQQGTATN
ncbi:jumonji family transcription factor [Cordyceps fumosorosea ARSEF 2679]|uniref:[histone H3]-trimethyl-L-lysine(9) demethylase n=1 Tax=Cordyceps fumosorosea (strain ARSEF 2679) TaxID=1081104 RepID=A0A167LB64_CORFA|nr:jumonji family transcription factor [Cordyceps fumosorosea ARSEF 2679]OAA52874.1 jumonji family transcription factor [Cordyceps fumosorosea ARSEF 2679]